MTKFPVTDLRGLLPLLNRRQVLKGAAAVAGAAAFDGAMTKSYAQENVLNVLTWPGHGEPAFVKPFEDQYGVKVVVKEYVGGEPMLALMNQSPPGTFDVVLADAEYIGMLQEGGFIDELNPADYPLGTKYVCMPVVGAQLRAVYSSKIHKDYRKASSRCLFCSQRTRLDETQDGGRWMVEL